MSTNKETEKKETLKSDRAPAGEPSVEVDRGLDIPTKPVSATVNALTTPDKAVKREVKPEPEPAVKSATEDDLKEVNKPLVPPAKGPHK